MDLRIQSRFVKSFIQGNHAAAILPGADDDAGVAVDDLTSSICGNILLNGGQ
jgi:hypothetical protein